MKNLQVIFMTLVCIWLGSCSKPGARPPAAVDSLVDEVWIELNSWKPIPLKQWLSESEANQVDFLTREEAVNLTERSLKEHGVELLAVTGDDTPHWAQFVVGNVKDLKDQAAHAKVLMAASASRKLEVEYGVKWLILTEQLDDDGNSVPKSSNHREAELTHEAAGKVGHRFCLRRTYFSPHPRRPSPLLRF